MLEMRTIINILNTEIADEPLFVISDRNNHKDEIYITTNLKKSEIWYNQNRF